MYTHMCVCVCARVFIGRFTYQRCESRGHRRQTLAAAFELTHIGAAQELAKAAQDNGTVFGHCAAAGAGTGARSQQ